MQKLYIKKDSFNKVVREFITLSDRMADETAMSYDHEKGCTLWRVGTIEIDPIYGTLDIIRHEPIKVESKF